MSMFPRYCWRNRLVLHTIQSSAQFNVPPDLPQAKKAFNAVATDLQCPYEGLIKPYLSDAGVPA